ncbi:NAD-dependent epimerase/dehydratase family protein [Rhodobacterales bacterium HKCCSP123]|nr:NAD-dependent epimerase/dehydratase family protein [Rhodobacterales bacterium HKCCSP123]
MAPTCLIALGGSGVIGKALSKRAALRGHDYVSISLDQDSFGTTGAQNWQVDLATVSPARLKAVLSSALAGRKLAGVVDIVGVGGALPETVATWVNEQAARLCVVSTCLLYDHDGLSPVDESHPIYGSGTDVFPYISKKRALEEAWRNHDCMITLVRTHHVLGHGGLLGCIPYHNRDPNLIRSIRSRSSLELVRGGDLWLSFIHAEDLAEILVKILCDTEDTIHVVNAVHPEPINALAYYREIAAQLGCEPPKVINVEPSPSDFWSLTAKNNVFESRSQILREHRFLFDFSSAIADTLSVDETMYESLGQFMQRRIQGET